MELLFGAGFVGIMQHPCYFCSGTLLQYANRKSKLKNAEQQDVNAQVWRAACVGHCAITKLGLCHAEEHIHCSVAALLVYFALPLPFIPPFSCLRPACTSPHLTMTVRCPHSYLKMRCRNVDTPQG